MLQRAFSHVVHVLRALRVLPRFPKKISKEAISRLPVSSYQGEIIFVDTVELAQQSVREIQKETLVGFDTESRPAFSKGEKYPPSIVQVATEDKVYIFQLPKIGQLRHLKPFLENPKIEKVGIAIHDDVLKLCDIEPFRHAGFRDISETTRALGVEQTGLRNLCAIFLRCRISKSSQVTDWSQEKLSARQLVYAATDAWISRQLYLEVQRQNT
ncbi:MAG: 3'-5' exonuclease domain-containing protein 2 [Opitutales bacterium]|nr:3'-5' exonuclease domain-containing protein 2 [Opitutales bacterium]